MLASVGVGLFMVPALRADGEVLIDHTEKLSARLVDLSKKHVEVYRVLKALTTSSVYGALVLELGSILLAIANNHGIKMPGLGGQGATNEEVAA
jgi:hypothetical protein